MEYVTGRVCSGPGPQPDCDCFAPRAETGARMTPGDPSALYVDMAQGHFERGTKPWALAAQAVVHECVYELHIICRSAPISRV